MNEMRVFLEDKVNRLSVIVVVLFLGVYVQNYCTYLELINSTNKLHADIVKTEKKVDFRYFNTTRSLQDLYGVEIDTHYGRVVK